MADIAVTRADRAGGIDWSAVIVAGIVGGILFLVRRRTQLAEHPRPHPLRRSGGLVVQGALDPQGRAAD